MKTYKCLISIIMISLFSTGIFAQKSLQKVLTTTVQPGESNLVFFDLPGEVEVKVWERNYIKVEITVETNLCNEEVFQYLKESGRYNIKKEYNKYYFLVLNLPNISEEVLVNGTEIEELFKFKVTVPWDIDIDPENKSDLTIENNLVDETGNVLTSNQIKY